MPPDLMAPVTWDGGAPKWHALGLRSLMDSTSRLWRTPGSCLRSETRDTTHSMSCCEPPPTGRRPTREFRRSLYLDRMRAVGKPGSCLPHERRPTPLRLEAAAT